MEAFRASDAWSLGTRFFSDQPANHALILIGMGILVPFVLQYLVIGQAIGILSAAGTAGLVETTAAGAVFLAALTVGYLLQGGSYFASWRLGFGRGASLGGAILFGLATGLLVIVAALLVMAATAIFVTPFSTEFAGLAAVAILLVPMALVATAVTALVAMAIAAFLLFAITIGVVTGNLGYAAMIAGGSGAVVVLFILLAAALLWLASRMSCAMPLLAERRSFNLPAAMAESWRLTSDDQWAILRYLALLGFGLALLLFVVIGAVGAGLAMNNGGNGPSGLGAAGQFAGAAAAVPLAYVSVLVPAGIYRALSRAPAPVEVFA